MTDRNRQAKTERLRQVGRNRDIETDRPAETDILRQTAETDRLREPGRNTEGETDRRLRQTGRTE